MRQCAWHFVGSTLRDGRPVPDNGVMLRHNGQLKVCSSGLHASSRLIDALKYAPGNNICRVRMSGEIQDHGDKMVASERTILWRVNGEDLLREFARLCALDVIHLWNAPYIVQSYLKSGDKSLRDAARDAASAAAWAAMTAANAAADGAANAANAAANAARDAAKDADNTAATMPRNQNKRLVNMVINAYIG